MKKPHRRTGEKSLDRTPQVRSTGASRPAEARKGVLFGILSAVTDWTWRLLVVGAALVVVLWLAGQIWIVLLPLFVGLLMSTILWPPVRWLRRFVSPAAAALAGVTGLLAFVAGAFAVIAPIVLGRGQELADDFSAGLGGLRSLLAGPPFNLGNHPIVRLIDQAVGWVQEHAQSVTAAALRALSALGSTVLTLLLAIVLTFFLLKDGPRFLPWLRQWTSSGALTHIETVAERIWTVLGRYIWSQAAIAAVDGLLIGFGVWLVGVPLALPIAILTFFGGFVPIVGAFAAGAVAVLVALLSNGVWPAVIVLAIVVAVQQLEGNLLQPALVGQSTTIHPAVVIAAVTAGGARFGIAGALLAVPATTAVIEVARYAREWHLRDDDADRPSQRRAASIDAFRRRRGHRDDPGRTARPAERPRLRRRP